MNVRRTLLLSLLLCCTFSTAAGELLTVDRPIPGSYVVVLKEAPGLQVAAEARGLAAFHGGRVAQVWEHALQGFLLEADERVARAIASDRRVAYVQQNGYIEPFAIQAAPHWGLDRIDERDRPLNNHFTYDTTGSGVNIYVIDTGIAANSDLSGRIVNAFTTVRDINGNPEFGDCNGHGTEVAKLAGGTTAGVAKGAKLHAVRVGKICSSDCAATGGGPKDPPAAAPGACAFAINDVVTGMDWVTANRVRPAIANVSLGGNNITTIDDAARRMHNAGVVVVAAAGNDGVDACGVSPARVAEAITVGASDSNDARSVWVNGQSSNTGTCLDLFAPGSNVNGFNGTSGSAPLVSGAAALYLQTNTGASPATVRNSIVNNATLNRLSGVGTSANRLLFVPPGGTETDAKPVANFTCGCNGGTSCTFIGASTDDFAVKTCRYTVGYDNFNRPIFRYGCGTVTYNYSYPGPYLVDLLVTDDGNQTSSISKWCQ